MLERLCAGPEDLEIWRRILEPDLERAVDNTPCYWASPKEYLRYLFAGAGPDEMGWVRLRAAVDAAGAHHPWRGRSPCRQLSGVAGGSGVMQSSVRANWCGEVGNLRVDRKAGSGPRAAVSPRLTGRGMPRQVDRAPQPFQKIIYRRGASLAIWPVADHVASGTSTIP